MLPYEPRRHVPWGLFDLILLVALYLGAVLVVAAVGQLLDWNVTAGVTKENAGQMLLLQLAIQLLSTFPGLAVIALRTRAGDHDLGFDIQTIGRDLLTGAIAFTMLAPPVFAIQAVLTELIPYQHDIIDIIRQNPSLLSLAGVSAVVVAPVTEEMQFRVLLQGWLEKLAVWKGSALPLLVGDTSKSGAGTALESQHEETLDDAVPNDVEADALIVSIDADSELNPYRSPRHPGELAAKPTRKADELLVTQPPRWWDRWPILLSAFLFAGMHFGQGPAPVPLFVLALGLGYLYERTHRALPAITVHLLLNGSTMIILAVEVLFPSNT